MLYSIENDFYTYSVEEYYRMFKMIRCSKTDEGHLELLVSNFADAQTMAEQMCEEDKNTHGC